MPFDDDFFESEEPTPVITQEELDDVLSYEHFYKDLPSADIPAKSTPKDE